MASDLIRREDALQMVDTIAKAGTVVDDEEGTEHEVIYRSAARKVLGLCPAVSGGDDHFRESTKKIDHSADSDKMVDGDLIYRQAAIDALDCINGTEEVLRSLPSAQPETHEERTETHACDLISRQAAIDALDCINGIEEVLRSLPSAQPEIIRCKDCREFRRWIDTDITFCDLTESKRDALDFCSRAERRRDG